MLLLLLLLAVGTSRYQFLSKGDAIDVITLPKEDAPKGDARPKCFFLHDREATPYVLFAVSLHP